MKKRVAKKIKANLPTYVRDGEPRYGRYRRDQVRRAMARLYPPGLLRCWMPRFPLIEDQSLDRVRYIDDEAFLARIDEMARG